MLPATVGAQILLDHTGRRAGTDEEAEALASRLGGLPLALRLAGAHLAETTAAPWPSPTATFRGYQAPMEARRLDEVLGAATPPALIGEQSHKVISRAWELSLDLLDRRGMPEARSVLRLLSFLADAPIPYALVLHPDTLAAASSELFADMEAARLWQLLRALGHLGLVDLTVNSSGQAVRTVKSAGATRSSSSQAT
jgi:hypothetical protein